MKMRSGVLAFALAAVPALGHELVKDINAVPANTGFVFPDSYRTADVANGTLFKLQEETHGSELWITDGTAAGTKLLKDINLGAPDSQPFLTAFPAVLNNKLLFQSDVFGGVVHEDTLPVSLPVCGSGSVVRRAEGLPAV